MKKICTFLFLSYSLNFIVAQNQQPLTVREVYDFNVGDIFIYRNDTYNFIIRRKDTLYERKTILTKRLYLPDSIVYTIKSESAFTSSFNQVSIKNYNFVVTDLDSLALFKIKPRTVSGQSPNIKDHCEILYNSNRHVNSREFSGLIDYYKKFSVGQGIGIVRDDQGLQYENGGNSLIYFKKNTEI